MALAVQRQVHGQQADPLDPAATSRALAFYGMSPQLYTAAVIQRLRAQVGLAAGGGVDAALVQAVARWQRDHGAGSPALPVDGMADTRTLSRLFPSGLNAAGQGAAFGADAQASVFARWQTLGTARARAQALVDQINKRLQAAGVPPVRLRLFNGSPHERGSFGIAAWTMQLNERLLGLGGLDQAGAQGLAETVFHEGRHVQQWFWMARLRAGQGRSAATITTEMGIPARIAHAARNSPIRPGTVEGVIASGWWESVYGAASPWREATLASITEASWRFTTEQCRFQLFPTPVNQARVVAERAFFRSMHGTYVALPEETDAWATGPGGRAGVTGTAHPMPVPPMDPCAELTRHGRPQPGPTPSPAVDGDRSGAGPAAAEGSGEGQQTEIDRPEVSPPTIDGPLHGVLPEDSLPA